ncbi:MAG: argininosuccinate lyase, partial [Polyangiales bacterium]
VTLLVMLKGLPLAYNRDLQEDKPPVFDAFDTVDVCLRALAGAIATARFDAARMRAALQQGFVDATELADYLTAKSVPFRDAHHVAGRLVSFAIAHGKTLPQLSLDELRRESPAFAQDVYAALAPEAAVERRKLTGGPARAMVESEIAALRERLRLRGFDAAAVARRLGVEA